MSRKSVSFSCLNESGWKVHDDARQARGIEHALLEVELPGAVLLRQQPPLQAVGEASHDALQMGELLVEVGAQARQLVGIAGPRRGRSRRTSG